MLINRIGNFVPKNIIKEYLCNMQSIAACNISSNNSLSETIWIYHSSFPRREVDYHPLVDHMQISKVERPAGFGAWSKAIGCFTHTTALLCIHVSCDNKRIEHT